MIESGKCSSDCCGPVGIPKEIWAKHSEKVIYNDLQEINNEIVPFTKDFKCVFLGKCGECKIYEERPKVCVDYGLIDELICPYIKKNGSPRSPAAIKHYQRIINHQIDDKLKSICENK